MEETKLKTPVSGSDPIVKPKIDLKGNHAATPGGKGEKRDATSPPIPPKPQLEKKTREEPSGDAKARGDNRENRDEEIIETDDPGSPSHVHVFSKPMHPNDILQIVTELRALMLPEIRNIITENTPDTKTIVFEAVKSATDSLTKQINSVKTENASLREKCSKLEKRVSELETENSTRKLESDALEQYGRRNILRVSGIPETDREDTDDIVLRVASDLGVPMSPREIDRSHRVGKVHTGRGPKPNRKHRDIIVKFTTYNARNRLFQERKSLRETDNEDLNNIFLNEDLTKRRSEILFEARKLRRSNKLKSAYSSDGKIIVRDKKDKKYQIAVSDDLVQFGYVNQTAVPGGYAPPPTEETPSTSGAGAMD